MKIYNFCVDRFRYLILGLAFCCLMSVSSNISAFNIAQVCMANSLDNTSSLFSPVNFTASEVSLMNGATGLGLLAATLPITRLYIAFGAYWPFLLCGLGSAIVTGLLPFAIELHLYVAVTLRFLQICASSFGWPFVFFIHSIAGIVVFGLLFAVFFRNRPQDSGFVSSVELEMIQRDKSVAQINQHSFVPYKSIFTDVVVCVVWINAFFELLPTNFLSVYSPYYLKNVLNYEAKETGHLSAISRITQVPFRILSGLLSDNITSIGENKKLIIFNSITMFLPGLLFALATFLPLQSPILIVIDFGLVNFFCGAASAGFYKCAALYGRQYGQFILAMFQLLKSITLFLGPALFALLVQDEHSQSEWSRIFWLFALTMITSNFLFFKFSTDKPASYTATAIVDNKVELQEFMIVARL